MEIQKPLAQLKSEVDDIPGLQVIPSGRNDKILKKDYARALQKYNLVERYETITQAPKNLRFRLSFDGPQLALQYSQIKDDVRNKIWEDFEYRLTVKERGVRVTIVYTPDEGFSVYPREVNEDNYLFDDYASKLFSSGPYKGINSALAIDVEVQLSNEEILAPMSEAGLIFENNVAACILLLQMNDVEFETLSNGLSNIFNLKLLDVYFFGERVTSKPYSERTKHFEIIISTINENTGVKISVPEYCDDPVLKKAFHEGVISRGLEGTVAVPLSQPCILDLKRPKGGWIKIKTSIFPEISDPSILDDTVDVEVKKVNMSQEWGIIESVEVQRLNVDEGIPLTSVDMIPLSMKKGQEIKEGVILETNALKVDDDGKLVRPIVIQIRRDKKITSSKASDITQPQDEFSFK